MAPSLMILPSTLLESKSQKITFLVIFGRTKFLLKSLFWLGEFLKRGCLLMILSPDSILIHKVIVFVVGMHKMTLCTMILEVEKQQGACGTPLEILNTWWSTRTENAIHKVLLKIIPGIICSEIWKQWCVCNMVGKDTSFTTK